MNYKEIPMFDNHTHTLDPNASNLDPIDLALNFLHGYKDILPQKAGEPFGMSSEFKLHLSRMGAVLSMVNRMAGLFGCESDLDKVTAERNKRTADGISPYIKMLYKESNIIGTVLDSDLPMNHSTVDLFPCRVFRLYKFDAAFYKTLNQTDSYQNLKLEVLRKIHDAVKNEKYCGIKCHISEIFSLEARPVSDNEAEKAFPAAVKKDRTAIETLYYGVFSSMLLLAQELDVPVHVHTGVTGQSAITGQPGISGEIKQGRLSDTDPFLLAPFLKEHKYLNTKLILLHAAYPWLENAAMMTHLFPHVWIDLSWTLPWVSIGFEQYLENVLAIAPHSKIMLGSGQHGIPEMAWLASGIARTSLENIMKKAVNSQYLSEVQANDSAEMVMYKNAKRLYRF